MCNPLARTILPEWHPAVVTRGAVRWSQEISKNASFNNLIKLQGIPDWYDNPQHPYSNNFLDNYFLLLLAIFFPAVAFVSLYTKRENLSIM